MRKVAVIFLMLPFSYVSNAASLYCRLSIVDDYTNKGPLRILAEDEKDLDESVQAGSKMITVNGGPMTENFTVIVDMNLKRIEARFGGDKKQEVSMSLASFSRPINFEISKNRPYEGISLEKKRTLSCSER
jgi:hypothetical protein